MFLRCISTHHCTVKSSGWFCRAASRTPADEERGPDSEREKVALTGSTPEPARPLR